MIKQYGVNPTIKMFQLKKLAKNDLQTGILKGKSYLLSPYKSLEKQ